MPVFDLEINGPNVISESERSGKARSLFWPWAGANVSLLALSYGAFFWGLESHLDRQQLLPLSEQSDLFYWWELAHLPGKDQTLQRWFCREHLLVLKAAFFREHFPI